jgi:hypothetical protein
VAKPLLFYYKIFGSIKSKIRPGIPRIPTVNAVKTFIAI